MTLHWVFEPGAVWSDCDDEIEVQFLPRQSLDTRENARVVIVDLQARRHAAIRGRGQGQGFVTHCWQCHPFYSPRLLSPQYLRQEEVKTWDGSNLLISITYDLFKARGCQQLWLKSLFSVVSCLLLWWLRMRRPNTKILLAADINFQKKTWETVENYRLVSPNDC